MGIVPQTQGGDAPEVGTAGEHTYPEAPYEAPDHRGEVDIAESIEQIDGQLKYTQQYLLDPLRYGYTHELVGV